MNSVGVGFCQFGSPDIFCDDCEELKSIFWDFNIVPSVYHLREKIEVWIEVDDITPDLLLHDLIRDCYDIPFASLEFATFEPPSTLVVSVFI